MRVIRAILITTLICFAAGAPAARGGPLDAADVLQPDVYPSQTSAVRALGKVTSEAMLASPDYCPDRHPVAIQGNADDDAKQALARLLRNDFPSLKVQVDPTESAGDDASVLRIELSISGKPKTAPTRSIDAQDSGVIALSAHGPGLTQDLSARFVEKPWAEDWTAYVNAHPQQKWVRAQSPKLASSAEEAAEAARDHASQQLWPLVRKAMNDRYAGRPGAIPVSEAFARRQIESMLREGKSVADRFVQRVERPYGEVYKASLLVDASEKSVGEMAAYTSKVARQAHASRQAQAERKVIGWGSVAGFVAVIVLMYALVNSLTRGYFMWRLRTAALLLSIVGILIVLAVT